MERWIEAFKGRIPKDNYIVNLIFGEENGLIVRLTNKNKYSIEIDFGNVKSFRVLDEGIVIDGVFSECETNKFKNGNFSNVIYEIRDGVYLKDVLSFAGPFAPYLDLKHYVVVSMNFVIEIITEWEPKLRN